jgi:SAM-dependent methyltransferase
MNAKSRGPNAEPLDRLPLTPIPLAKADLETGQNIDHSLAAQEWMAHAIRYNGWLVDSLFDAWTGSSTVLDVGCSIGNVTHIVADRLAAGGQQNAKVVGVEIIPEAARRFRERHHGRSDLHVVCGNIIAPPAELMALAPFDTAVSFNVLEHIENDVRALHAIGGLLKPGGRLGLLVPGGGNRLYGTLDALDRHFRRYTPSMLRDRLEAAGYVVVWIRRVNMVGAVLWFLKGRVLRSRHATVSEVSAFDRMVPALRRIDATLGPPFGQSLAAVAVRPSLGMRLA